MNININGKRITPNKTKISAYPLNRVWPGYQRSEEQTKEAYFVSFKMDGDARIEIEMPEIIEQYDIRPSYMNIKNSVNEKKLSIELNNPCNISVEINGETLCLFADNKDYSEEKTDGDVIYFGKGKHYPGIISPKSGQTVFIDEGAIVYGGIFIKESKNVRVIGRGVLDASCLKRGEEAMPGEKGSEFADAIRGFGLSERDVKYSGAFVAYGCENLQIEGITILNSMFWTMILRNGCKNVRVNNIKIFGQWRYNSDGINICASSDIKITNSFIRSFDDCVVVRGPFLDGESGDMSNIVVNNCVLWCDWGINMEIFCTDKAAVISNIKFKNNYVARASGIITDIQTWFGSENAVVRDVLYENIMIDSNKDTLKQQYQVSDEQQYVFTNEKQVPVFAVLKCGKIGRNLGNQQFEPIEDTSHFNSLYENITYRNIHSEDVYDFKIERKDDILKVKNITFENCSFGEKND